jgi:deazaflavin-dependent oxidoreductase (nitroreductase family)
VARWQPRYAPLVAPDLAIAKTADGVDIAWTSVGSGQTLIQRMLRSMSTPSTEPSTAFVAGPPRRSGPIRAIARPFGPIANRVAGTRLFPLWAILRHTGRTSGKAYATPVVALRTPDGFMIPLPFGDATQWAKNLFAAGGGSIRFAGREHRIIDPQIVDRDVAATHMPRVLHFVAGHLGLRQFVLVKRISE